MKDFFLHKMVSSKRPIARLRVEWNGGKNKMVSYTKKKKILKRLQQLGKLKKIHKASTLYNRAGRKMSVPNISSSVRPI